LAIDKKLIERISDITKKVYKIFELSGVIRVDYMMVNGKILLNEINTTPGSFAYYLFETEISELLSRLIYEGLKVYQNQKKTVFESSVLDQDYNYKK
jgi:D-alanine-D-alanine ligase